MFDVPSFVCAKEKTNRQQALFGLNIVYVLSFACAKEKTNRQQVLFGLNIVYVLSFACAKESTKEKHSANDVRPLAPP